MNNSWHHFSVEEFFNQHNWSGKISEHQNSALQEIPWLCQKIAEFFSQSNWQGAIYSEISNTDFSLTLSVAGFFQFFAWDNNNPPILSLSELESIPDLASDFNDELKLDDFGNLF